MKNANRKKIYIFICFIYLIIFEGMIYINYIGLKKKIVNMEQELEVYKGILDDIIVSDYNGDGKLDNVASEEDDAFAITHGATSDGSLPNILVIGDSISIGWISPVYDALKEEYDISLPMVNGRNSYYSNKHFDACYEKWPAEIIIWNNGTWDCTLEEWHDTYAFNQPKEWYGTTLEEYKENIISTARKMKATGARVIFFTTTPLPNGAEGIYKVGYEKQLNEIAKNILPNEGVEVYDLYQYAVDVNPERLTSTNEHFSEKGNKILAEFVIKAIKGEIKSVG